MIRELGYYQGKRDPALPFAGMLMTDPVADCLEIRLPCTLRSGNATNGLFLCFSSGDNQPELQSFIMQVTNGRASNPAEYASNPVF